MERRGFRFHLQVERRRVGRLWNHGLDNFAR